LSKTIEVTIEDEKLFSLFVKESEQLGLSVEAAMAEAIKEWLFDMREDREDAEYAEKAITEYKREGGIPIEDVLKERGLSA
jgi:hypothetical protein